MLQLLLLSPSLADDEPAHAWSDLSVVAGMTSQFSTVAGDERILELGPRGGVAWHRSTIRLEASGAHSRSTGGRGRFSTTTLAGAITPSVRSASGRPVFYIGAGAALVWFQGQITERRWNGWQLEHDEQRAGLAIHGALAWRVVHQERFAIELDYTQRVNFLQDSVISGQHHILSACLWINPTLW